MVYEKLRTTAHKWALFADDSSLPFLQRVKQPDLCIVVDAAYCRIVLSYQCVSIRGFGEYPRLVEQVVDAAILLFCCSQPLSRLMLNCEVFN